MAKRAPAKPAATTAAGRIETRPPAALRPHPRAAELPAIGAAEFGSLKADIESRGIQVPLEVTAAGVVLDGHLRLRAATELGLVSLPVRLVNPADQFEYMSLALLQRQHLSPSQRAALAVEQQWFIEEREAARQRQRANLKHPAAAEVAELPPQGKTRDRAAGRCGASPRTVQNALLVREADPQLFEQIKAGKLPVDRATRQVRQRLRDAELATAPPLPEGLFDFMLCDPPWLVPGAADSSRAVQNHYPLMPLEQILALQIPAAADALLFLWAVPTMLPEALQVMEAWGFTYIDQAVWVKDKIGLGSYVRHQHELLLIGRRGSFPPPAPNRRHSSVLMAPRGRHSAKPVELYELLERAYPHTRKLELFARKPRPGWHAWGNQADGAETA